MESMLPQDLPTHSLSPRRTQAVLPSILEGLPDRVIGKTSEVLKLMATGTCHAILAIASISLQNFVFGLNQMVWWDAGRGDGHA